MGAIITYLIKSILVSGVFYSYYHLLLKNKSFHSFNRFYLVTTIVLSATAPMIKIGWLHPVADNNPFYKIFNVTTTTEPHPNGFMTVGFWVLMACLLISLSLLIALAFKIKWIYRIKKSYRNTNWGGFTFIETDVRQAPFSFFDNLFWRQGLSLEDANGKKIFTHELTHIMQRHTYDRLFMQIMSCIFWLNPFYWLLQKELLTVHEFIADAAAVGKSDSEAFASMLLYSHNSGSYLRPTLHFFTSQIKRRLTMINSFKKTRYSWLRKALVLPVTFAVMAVLSLNSDAQISPQSVRPVLHSSIDTVPKKSGEPITVTGYNLKKKGNQPTPPPASAESLKPVTVIGYKIEKKTTEKKEEKKAF